MNEMKRQARAERSFSADRLGLPRQAAPIDRTTAGVALSTGEGVEASFWGALIPIAATVASKLL